jgi:hypothetical protein
MSFVPLSTPICAFMPRMERLDDLAELSPWDDSVHLDKKDLAAGLLVITLKTVFSECLLAHKVNLRAA